MLVFWRTRVRQRRRRNCDAVPAAAVDQIEPVADDM
jgi:hypothetical protein